MAELLHCLPIDTMKRSADSTFQDRKPPATHSAHIVVGYTEEQAGKPIRETDVIRAQRFHYTADEIQRFRLRSRLVTARLRATRLPFQCRAA